MSHRLHTTKEPPVQISPVPTATATIPRILCFEVVTVWAVSARKWIEIEPLVRERGTLFNNFLDSIVLVFSPNDHDSGRL